jgi:hypothetical protein
MYDSARKHVARLLRRLIACWRLHSAKELQLIRAGRGIVTQLSRVPTYLGSRTGSWHQDTGRYARKFVWVSGPQLQTIRAMPMSSCEVK